MDELNILRTTKKKREVLPITQYFGEMDLDEKQTEERVGFAIQMRDLLLIVFALVELGNTDKAEQTLKDGYLEIAEKYHTVDDSFERYISKISKEIVNTTKKNLSKTDTSIDKLVTNADKVVFQNDNSVLVDGAVNTKTGSTSSGNGNTNTSTQTSKGVDGDDYYVSTDRAILIAENEANATLNNVDLLRAKQSGKTQKKWITMKDRGVRQTHQDVDDEIIGIDEYFEVGVSMMRFPKDYNGINVTGEETVNCRCTIEYL